MPGIHLLRCSCGRTYQPKPEHAGRSIRCKCGRIVPIPAATGFGLARFRSAMVVRRLGAVLVWGWLASVVGLAGLLWGFGDAWWLGSLFLYGPRWPILLPAPFLVIIALVIRPRWLVPVGLGALVALGPVLGGRIGWRQWQPASDGIAIRLATFNMRGSENPLGPMVPGRLADLEADLILIQECADRFRAEAERQAGWVVRQERSLCLMSRFPVDSSESIDVIRTNEDGMTGLAVVYFLAIGGRSVPVVNLHLETPRKGIERVRWGGEVTGMARNILIRDAGSRRVAAWVRSTAPGALVGGDFNLVPESRVFRRNWGWCQDAFSRVGRGFGYTRILPKWSARIDHVLLCAPTWRAVSARLGPDLGSDHLPLVVDLVLRSDDDR